MNLSYIIVTLHNLLDSKVASHLMLAVWLLLDSSVVWVVMVGTEVMSRLQSPTQDCEA